MGRGDGSAGWNFAGITWRSAGVDGDFKRVAPGIFLRGGYRAIPLGSEQISGNKLLAPDRSGPAVTGHLNVNNA